MQKTVLITGAGPTGVTGRTIKEQLESKYKILAPSSKELDLTDDRAVREYFDLHQIDYVVHCATYRRNISQTNHLVDEELESNLRMYFALAAQSNRFEKMVYFGSGAEFNKSKPIVNVSEDQFGGSIPKDKYGLGKYIMNLHCRSSKNIYNLRMFGTLNKYERYTKNVVCNLCAKAVLGLPLTLKQNVRFSWVDIDDVSNAVDYLFQNDVIRNDYNMALSQPFFLSDIAILIREISKKDLSIKFEKTGYSNEYTCLADSFKATFPIKMKSIKDSLCDIYNHIDNTKNSIDVNSIDSRWNH